MVITKLDCSDYNLRNCAYCLVKELGKCLEERILKVVIADKKLMVNNKEVPQNKLSVSALLRLEEFKNCVKNIIPFKLLNIVIDGNIINHNFSRYGSYFFEEDFLPIPSLRIMRKDKANVDSVENKCIT